MGIREGWRELSRLAAQHKMVSLIIVLTTVYFGTIPLAVKTPRIPVASERIEEARRKLEEQAKKQKTS